MNNHQKTITGIPAEFPWRGIIAGAAGVIAIGLAAPVNDWVMRNTPLVGSFLSIGVLMALLLLVGVVNAIGARFIPFLRLRQGDLVAALVLLLVGSSFASVGLMRYLPGHLVAFWDHAASNPTFATLLDELHLPEWLFPVGGPIAQRGRDDVVRYFFTRTPGSDGSLIDAIHGVPWGAWLLPIATWGVLIAMILLSLVAALLIFLPQWSQVERLPFPLARVYGSLIEPPAAGRALNTMLSSRRFWIAFAAVFLLHLTNGLSVYTAGVVPMIPAAFNLSPIMSEAPWSFTEVFFREQTIYFSIIGMMFFVQTGRALSLWLAMVLLQVIRMILGSGQVEISTNMAGDQMHGAILAMGLVTFFLARHHLGKVFGAAFGFSKGPAPVAGRWAARLMVVGLIGQIVWLMLAGASFIGAALIAVLLLVLYLVVARTLAETGIPYVVLPIDFRRFTLYALHDVPGIWTPTRTDGFFAGVMHGVFTHDTRESAAGFVSTALQCEQQAPLAASPRRRTAWLIGLIAFGLLLAYMASWAGYLTADYRYAATLDRLGDSPVNSWGASGMPQSITLDFVANRMHNAAESHSRPVHVLIGAGVLIVLMFATVRLPWWPLHPVGYLLMHTWGLKTIWFSIFLGWLVKVLIVRFGGARLLQASQPVFLGLILGEACSAAFWLLFAVLRLNAGQTFERIQLLPT